MKTYKNQKSAFMDNLKENIDPQNKLHIKIFNYINRNYKKVSYMNMQELLEALKLDHDTLIEFLTVTGFNNYEEFRNSLRKIIAVNLKSTDSFQISLDMIEPKANNIMSLIINKEIQNLNRLANTFDEKNFRMVIEEILNSSDIIIVGTRASAPIAVYAEYMFNRIGKKTRKIISGGTENFDSIHLIDRNTLIIGLGFARYPKETIKIIRFFKKMNFKVISITDNSMSPLARFSDIILSVPYESISFTDFYAAPISIINAIVILISQLDENTSLKHLNEFENVAKEIGFYF